MNKTRVYTIGNRTSSQQTASRTIPVYAPGRTEARERVRTRAASRQATFPRWAFFAALILLTFAVCVMLNVKASMESQKIQQQQTTLREEITQLQNGNMTIADEVDRLQMDSATIERAARERLNMLRPDEKVLVPAR